MAVRILFIFLLIPIFFVSACTPTVPRWRQEAQLLFDKVCLEDASNLLSEEYRSVERALIQGDARLADDDIGSAEVYFRFALTKGMLLESNIEVEKNRRKEEVRLRMEAQKQEQERQREIVSERRRLEIEKAEVEAHAKAEADAKKNALEKGKGVRERQLPANYTVKRGETLPMIAAQSDIYNDLALWPLIYRANRDQISDPRHIWPGQVLRIPRNLTRDDISEARRYAQGKPLR